MANKQKPNLNAAMAEFAKDLWHYDLDAKDFRVLVASDVWPDFVEIATGRADVLCDVTKVTLGTIDFIPDK